MLCRALPLLWFLLLYCRHPATGLNIYVDQNSGTNSSSCWTGGAQLPCVSLGLGLQGLQQYNHTSLWLANGTYILLSGNLEGDGVDDYRFVSMEGIVVSATHIDKNDDYPVEVLCEGSVGLSFIYSSNITIRGVKFVGCGAEQYSTSRLKDDIQFRRFHAALYFLYVSDVTLEFVKVTDSYGTGVVMYATVGTNTIAHSAFTGNAPSPGTSGGGGLYIEFPYCAPILSEDVQNCSEKSNVPQHYVSYSQFTIERCVFSNNTANILNETDSTFILPHLQVHLAFGRGGGLSVFFKGHSSNNSIHVSNSDFISNNALWGAGLFVEYQDMSFNNTFSVESSLVENNQCFHHSSEQKGTGGGGARLGHIFFDTTHASCNNMSFSNVKFSENKAYYGGGLSLYSTREPSKAQPTNTLVFHGCKWMYNVARVGSGVDLSVWHPVPYGAIMAPNFTDCLFEGNTAEYTSVLGEYVGIGAFYSDFIPVNFLGDILFYLNRQSALACIGAQLSFHANCTAEFIDNSGRNGGAVALMGYSFIQVSRNTTITFQNNSAEFVGGAIYAQSIGEHDLISSRNCFVRYDDIEVTPWDWEAVFIFENNTANKEVNSIYATSLLTCLWGGAYGSASTDNDTQNVFCWNSNQTNPTQWVYSSNNCTAEIATSAANFVLNMNNTNDCVHDKMCNISIKVIPGLSTVLPFYTIDDRKNNVTNASVLTAKVIEVGNHTHDNETSSIGNTYDNETASVGNTFLYISDNSILLYGTPNESAYVKFETIAPRVISMSIKVIFTSCPPGMVLTNGGRGEAPTCECKGNYGGLISDCHSIRYYTELRRGSWIGTLDNKSDFVVGECPYCSAWTSNPSFDLPQNGTNLSNNLCSRIHRTGVLCGSCLPGYGPAVNGLDFECHHCTESEAKYNWIFYLMTEFLPITLFFFIVVLFNVSITSGPANAFVFYAQVLTATFKVDGDGLVKGTNTLTALYVIPYDIWNQNFFHPILPKFCLSPSISTLQLLSTGYITALYPLILVIIFSLFLWAYGKGFKPVVCLCRPIHRCFARLRSIWNLQRSIVHALATYIILSYTKFTLVSFILLTTTPLLNDEGRAVTHVLYYDGNVEYMGPGHIPYVIASFAVLLTFVALPPIMLSTPSLIHWLKKVSRKLLNRDLDFPTPGPNLDQFLNAFHGCYKDGTGGTANNDVDCRWFAGLYFLLRLILFLVYAFTPNWYLQYVIQQLVCIGAVLIFVIFRPYKNNLFNVVDICIFANLAVISTLSMFNYHVTTTGSDLSMTWSICIQYVLIFLPLLYMVLYVAYLLYAKFVKWYRKRKPRANTLDEDDADFLQYADQEERYRDIMGSYQERASINVSRRLNNSSDPPSVVKEERESLLRNEATVSSIPTSTSQSSGYGATGESGADSVGQSSGIRLSQDTQTSAGDTGERSVTGNSSRTSRATRRSDTGRHHSAADTGTGRVSQGGQKSGLKMEESLQNITS